MSVIKERIINNIKNMNLTSKQKELLGINEKTIERLTKGDFIDKVMNVAEKYKGVLSELAKQ